MATPSPAEYETRIRALEKQCSVLAVEADLGRGREQELVVRVNRMCPVIKAAQVLVRSLRRHQPESWSGTEEALERVVTIYELSQSK